MTPMYMYTSDLLTSVADVPARSALIWRPGRAADTSTNRRQGFLCRRTASMEQAADRPQATAVDHYLSSSTENIFTARCHASAVLAMGLCLSVCLSVSVSVCLSQVGVLLKRLNGGSHKQHHTIPQGL